MLLNCVTFCLLVVLSFTLLDDIQHSLASAQEEDSFPPHHSVQYRSLASHYLHELIRNAQDELNHLTIRERSGSESDVSKVRNRSPTRRSGRLTCFPMCTSRQTADNEDIKLNELENILRAAELKSGTVPKSVRSTADMHQVQITEMTQFIYRFFKQQVEKTNDRLLRAWALQLGELLSVEEAMSVQNGGKLRYVANNPEWGNVIKMRLNFKASLLCYMPRMQPDPSNFRSCFPTLKGDYICGITVYYTLGDGKRLENCIFAKNTLKCEPATANKAQSPRPLVGILKKRSRNFSV